MAPKNTRKNADAWTLKKGGECSFETNNTEKYELTGGSQTFVRIAVHMNLRTTTISGGNPPNTRSDELIQSTKMMLIKEAF